MQRHYTIHVRAHNEHAVLQRMLLVFSRRRLRIQALQFFDVDASRVAEMQVDLDCRPEHARDVVAGLRAVVEVQDAWAEETALQSAEQAARVAA
jgi:acetolactate synthase small subunit